MATKKTYENIYNPYDNNLFRAPIQYEQENGGNREAVRNEGDINDLWIKSFIRSTNWKPKKQGFFLDGRTGYAEFADLFALKGTIGGMTINSDGLSGGTLTNVTINNSVVEGAPAGETTGRYIVLRCLNKSSSASVATNVWGDFESPITGTITDAVAFVDVVGTTGTMTIDVNKGGTTIMSSSKIKIDTGEKTSRTAVTLPAITTSALSIGDIITVDVDAIHTTPAKGLVVVLRVE